LKKLENKFLFFINHNYNINLQKSIDNYVLW